jgi:N-acyl-D-amino-acid deacylase
MINLLIVNGQIIDGTGNPGYYAAIAIEGDKVRVIRGDIGSISSKKVVNAAGRIVCPGFIDIHSHSALMLLANPRHEPKMYQGCTTEVIGIDGMGYAPACCLEDLKKHMRINAGADGAPQLKQRWLSVAEYLSHFDRKVACNIAYVIGNGMSWSMKDSIASPAVLAS